jgi:hypothetical protein
VWLLVVTGAVAVDHVLVLSDMLCSTI